MTTPKKENGHKPNSSSNNSNSGKEKRNISGSINVSGHVETSLPKNFVDAYKADSKQESDRDQIRLRIELVTLVFVVIVAIFSGIQTRQAIRSANASVRAADTAMTTLHITQRAYLEVGTPTIDIVAKSMGFSLVNTGKLPANDVKVSVYRMVIDSDDPSSPHHPLSDVKDAGREQLTIPSIGTFQNGPPNMVITAFNNADSQKVVNTHEQWIIVALVNYDAGFSDDPRQNFSFCLKTEREKMINKNAVTTCDPSIYLSTIKKFTQNP